MTNPAAIRTPGGVPGQAEQRRNARIYLTGTSASLLGNGAMSLVAGIWVKELTGSSSMAALAQVCVYAPTLLAAPAGMLADRLPRRRLLIAVNLAMALILLPLLAVRTSAAVWLIYAVMACYGLSMVVDGPASSGLFYTMFSLSERRRMNGLMMSITEGGKLVAPLFGAGLFELFGGGVVAALDSATFLVAVAALSRLRITEPRRGRPAGRWRTEAVAGFSHVWRTPGLRSATLAATLAMFASSLSSGAQYSLVTAVHQRPAFLGVFSAMLGAGSVVAGLVSARIIRRRGERFLQLAGLVNCALASALLTIPVLGLDLAAYALAGFALPWTVVAVINLSQRLTPEQLQGRVSAAWSFLLFGVVPFGQATGAAAIAHLSYRLPYAAAALLSGVAVLALAAAAQPPALEADPAPLPG
jgi:MFS family permease